MNKKTLKDVAVKGKRVLVRCDFNVPQDENGNITDENRIRGALPTIQYLLDNKAKVILTSHLGRPKGVVDEKYSLKLVADRLNEILGDKVTLASDVVGEDAKAKVAALEEGKAVMLENVRFHAEEEKNDPEFAKQLAALADIFCNDAFGTAHRAHASTAGIAAFVEESVCGFLIQKEIEIMGGALDNPARPFVAILGGAKVSDKIGVINNLLDKVDSLIIGGAMAYTFCKAGGGEVGNSKLEKDKVELAKELIAKAKEKNIEMLLPLDNVVTKEFGPNAESQVVTAGQVPEGWGGLDIGPKTAKAFSKVIKDAKTIVWNGPMGVFEFEKFAVGTKAIAEALANNKKAVTIIGGGDSAAAIEQLGFADKVTHISTGGGASLEYLEGIELPGIAVLSNKE